MTTYNKECQKDKESSSEAVDAKDGSEQNKTATTSNTNFTFTVIDVEVKDEGSLTDVIKSVNYSYQGLFDDSGSMLSHQVTGSFNCTDASSSDFIGFSTITSSDISSWTNLDSKKTSILNEINNSIDYLNKDTETRPLPSENT